MKLLSKRFILLAVTAALVLIPVAVSCTGSDNSADIPRAAIVDQLYDLHPDEAFTDGAASILAHSGFQADIIRGKEVTLDFYSHLPEYGYKIIVFRAHSGLLQLTEDTPEQKTGPTYLFTGEPYIITKNVWDQLGDRISPGRITQESTPVFAVSPAFISHDMAGSFRNTIIIMMGCATAYKSDMAESFINKRASAYIGWSASVTIDYTDKATLNLLNNLLTSQLSLQDAVATTMSEVGFDPQYNSRLKYYPEDAGQESVHTLLAPP